MDLQQCPFLLCNFGYFYFTINNELRKYISSGVILHKLEEEWDETYVLIFPIPNVGDYEMSDIECGIGQYLIEKKVPILDYYSHTFM